MIRIAILLFVLCLTVCNSKEHSGTEADTTICENSELNAKAVLIDLFKINPLQNDCELHDNSGDGYGKRCKEFHIHRKISQQELKK